MKLMVQLLRDRILLIMKLTPSRNLLANNMPRTRSSASEQTRVLLIECVSVTGFPRRLRLHSVLNSQALVPGLP